MRKIFKCKVCRGYTMQTEHCGGAAADAKPAKFSPEDKYAKYRRAAKEKQLQEEGIL